MPPTFLAHQSYGLCLLFHLVLFAIVFSCIPFSLSLSLLVPSWLCCTMRFSSLLYLLELWPNCVCALIARTPPRHVHYFLKPLPALLARLARLVHVIMPSLSGVLPKNTIILVPLLPALRFLI